MHKATAPIDFVEEILVFKYSDDTTEYTRHKYNRLEPFKKKCTRYMKQCTQRSMSYKERKSWIF